MALCAAVVIVEAAFRPRGGHGWEFLALMCVGAASSRLKVKLPGLNGNLSVNLPFIFIALTRLSMAEALVVAAVSVFIQSIPKAPDQFVPIRALFNTSTSLLAAGLGWGLFYFGLVIAHMNLEASLAMACTTHLLVSTVPVAVVLSLAENRAAVRTWSEILHLSFPYYVASAGLTSIAAGLGGSATWALLAGIACVMYVVYRSYRVYFNTMRKVQSDQTLTLAKAAAAN
jgi:hypothetical protein